MPSGTLETIAELVSASLAELEALLAPDHAIFFFEQLGARFPETVTEDPAVKSALEAASAAAAGFRPALDALRTAEQGNDTAGIIVAGLELIVEIADFLSALDQVSAEIGSGAWPPLSNAEVDDFVSGFPTRVLHDAIFRRLEEERPEIAGAAVLLGVADRVAITVSGADAAEAPVFARRLELGRLADALSRPSEYFRNLVGWGESPFDPVPLLERLRGFVSLFTANVVLDTSGPEPELISALFRVRRNTATTPPGIDLVLNFPLPDGFTFSAPVGPGYEVRLTASGGLPTGTTVTVTPPSTLSVDAPATVSFTSELIATPVAPETSVVVLGQTGATRLEAEAIHLSAGLELATDGSGTRASGDAFARLALRGGKAIVDFSEGDGFLQSLVPSNRIEAAFDVAATYGLSSGLTFEAGATLEVTIPLHVSFAGVEVNGLNLRLPIGQPGRAALPLDIATTVTAAFGPFTMVVDKVGLELDVTLGSGRLGVADVAVSPKVPSGIGATIDGGGISGGGFLFIDEATGRYAGALELRVFSIAVKAFGLLDTRFPDGAEGVSFVVVIVAEFTPIQLGFGFTLLGVGGLLGLNRTMDGQALGTAVRTGALEHLLFPRNPVQDAPAIINDLGTVFPASRGHFVLGPMAKLGWGTPTLISADLGVVLELPGPRIAVLGVVRMTLPSPDAALLRLQMAVAGLLDFPAQTLALDASLFDSTVVGFTVAGDMAFRLGFGSNAAFLLSVGGFNPGFKAPPKVPELRRASVDLGVNGNPSLVASGYFALTSNTAQIGASIELRASGAGIRLNGWLGFDVMFVFSPFSFTASISAGVRVSFHGVGFGISLRGTLSGPAPWHLRGKVCVSVLWWDACLGIEVKFGRAEPASLPEMDPWVGTPPEVTDERAQVLGLLEALQDPRNWSGSAPPAGFAVVSLAEAATAERTPIDPLGSATLRQKVAPLQMDLEKFGEYRPIVNTRFDVTLVTLNGFPNDGSSVPFVYVEDDFAPGHFMDLSPTEKLSMPSYDKMDAGITIAPDRLTAGSVGSNVLEYETAFITATGERIAQAPGEPRFRLTLQQLLAQLERSAAALAGVRRTGVERYKLPLDRPKKVVLARPEFVIVDACSLVRNVSIPTATGTRTQATLALRAHVRSNPADRNRFKVVPAYAARAA